MGGVDSKESNHFLAHTDFTLHEFQRVHGAQITTDYSNGRGKENVYLKKADKKGIDIMSASVEKNGYFIVYGTCNRQSRLEQMKEDEMRKKNNGKV